MGTRRDETPQLEMAWPPGRGCPAVGPPAGYAVRGPRPGDAAAFLGLMAGSDFGPWDGAKLAYNLGRVVPGGWFLAADASGRVVATAMGLRDYVGESASTGDLGWVYCHPGHRGNGLGLAVCSLATRCLLGAGFARVRLRTEPHRLPAVRLYLRLGFVPQVGPGGDPGPWREACRRLGRPFDPGSWRRALGGTGGP